MLKGGFGAAVTVANSSCFDVLLMILFVAQIFSVSLHSNTKSAEYEENIIYLPGADESIRNDIQGANKIEQSQHTKQHTELTPYTALVQNLKKITNRR